jgi:hypothetical protein
MEMYVTDVLEKAPDAIVTKESGSQILARPLSSKDEPPIDVTTPSCIVVSASQCWKVAVFSTSTFGRKLMFIFEH